MNEIVIALITAAGSILAVILTNKSANDKMAYNLQRNQAVTDTKIEELTREVRAHNHFAERMPVVEEQIKSIQKDVSKLKSYHEAP